MFMFIVYFCLMSIARSQRECPPSDSKVQICAPIGSFPDSLNLGYDFPAKTADAASLKKVVGKIDSRLTIVEQRIITGNIGTSHSCPLSRYLLPRRDQNQDFVRYRPYFPKLLTATACGWVNVTDTRHDYSIMSYATSPHANEFLLFYRVHTSALSLHVGDQAVDLFVTIPQSTMTHVCAWFDSRSNQLGVYINGVETSAGYPGRPIAGGGSLILGQDQDRVNQEGLDPNQSMSGSVDNFMIWPRKLTADEVGKMLSLCQCPSDFILAMTLEKVEFWGQSTYEVQSVCPTI